MIRVHLTWSDTNGHFGSRFFLEGGGTPFALNDLQYLAGQVSALWGTNMKADVSNSFSLTQVDCLDLGTNTGLTGTWQGSIAGTAGINELPSNTSVNIRSLIVQHYRGGHPVLHHPPASQTQVAGPRNWTGTFTTGVATHWNAMMAGITAISGHPTVNGLTPAVLLGYRPGASTGQVTPSFPTGYFVPTRFGTMRRRLTTRT